MNELNMNNLEPNKNFWKGPFLPILLSLPNYFLEPMHLIEMMHKSPFHLSENISKVIIGILLVSLPLILGWNWALRRRIRKTEKIDHLGEIKVEEERKVRWPRIIICISFSILLIGFAYANSSENVCRESSIVEISEKIYVTMQPKLNNYDSLESMILRTPEYNEKAIMESVKKYEDSLIEKYSGLSPKHIKESICFNELKDLIRERLNEDNSIETLISKMIRLSDILNNLKNKSLDGLNSEIAYIRDEFKTSENTLIKTCINKNTKFRFTLYGSTFRENIDNMLGDQDGKIGSFQVIKFDFNNDKSIKSIYLNLNL